MDWASFFNMFQPLAVGWIGDVTLASLFWIVAIMVLAVKFGVGADVGIMVGGGFLLVFSLIFPANLTSLVVFGFMAIAAGGAMRYLRK
jgi:hypothetical protein